MLLRWLWQTNSRRKSSQCNWLMSMETETGKFLLIGTDIYSENLWTPMFCNNCGTKNPDGAKYCSACGTRMRGQGQKYVYRILKNRRSWYVPTDLRIGKHLDRLWAVFGLSSAQNQRFTLFFDTACTLFSQNTAKVYCSSGVPPRVPGWRPQKSSAVRAFLPSMMPVYQLACCLRIRRTRYNSNSK